MRTLTCGVDVGTTVIKAAIFDIRAPRAPIAMEAVASPTLVPAPSRSEADMMEVFEACLTAIERASAHVDVAQIGSIGISGTACGAWLIDSAGAPVRSAILWNDGRAGELIAEWASDGTLNRIFAEGRNVPYPGFTLPTLAWLLEKEPESISHADAVLSCKDWLRFGMTGEIGTDEGDASYGPFAIRQRRWSPVLEKIAGLETAARLFPPILPAAHTRELLPAIAKRLGLPAGVQVGVGLTDIVACTLGAGGLATGSAVTVLGTSAVSTVIEPELSDSESPVGLTAAAPMGRWARTMVNTSGSMTLDWTAQLLYNDDLETMLAEAQSASENSSPIAMLPYLSGAGVVSPFAEPNAAAVIAGLRIGHTRADIARAAIQGLAYAVADCYGAIDSDVTAISAVGGAARSDFLLQTIADASGHIVQRIDSPTPGARGAALVAAWAAGQYRSDQELVDALADQASLATFLPREVPDDYRRYRQLSDAMRPLWSQWKRLTPS